MSLTKERSRAKRPPALGSFHFPVVGLTVPVPWRVGLVTFRPTGWTASRVEGDRAQQRFHANQLVDLRREFDELRWSTAVVRAREFDEARAMVKAALDVLRFFQQLRWRMVDTSWQTFGLADEVPWQVVDYWVTGRARGPIGGAHAFGIAAHWDMLKADHQAFHRDGLFQYLSAALRVTDDARSLVQRRALRCLEVLGADSHVMQPRARILLVTSAMEALLDDGKPVGAAHRTIRRAAYLTCGMPPDMPFHGPERGRCLYLVAQDRGAVSQAQRRRLGAGQPAACSTFDDLRALLDARNKAAHAGHAPGQREVQAWRGQVEKVIAAGLRWSIAADQEPIAALDDEIDGLPILA